MGFLLYQSPDGAEQRVALTGERLTIGRRASCDVALIWDDEVSRLHAELVPMGAEWVVQDDGLSHNGTFVNGERVRGRRRLQAGDTLSVGSCSISVVGAAATGAGSTRAARPAGAQVSVTPAQLRLLEVLCRPLLETDYAAASNQAIAAELVLSLDTVKGALTALYERFGLSELPRSEKRAALAVRAIDVVRAAQR